MEKDKLGQEPAFACVSDNRGGQERMSKRFYAACAAMQGMLANGQLINDLAKKYGNEPQITNIVVDQAYRYADELLKQE